MKKIINKAKYVMTGEDGASNVEIIVWISVVLAISTVLWIFRDSIISFIEKATGKIDGFRYE